ncbi:MAG: TIGR01457 family HAD-type hydrolase [Caryophanon sp.]|nr:TIGR01457 family HAD-type hydrolase [Caryophanon sp.]
MKQYKAYCFDLDGTVYKGKHVIDTAVSYIHMLQARGIEPFYVTNNSSKTTAQIQETLRAFHIEAPATHIYSSAMATAQYVQHRYPNARVRIMGEDGIRDAAQTVGLQLVDGVEADVFVMGIDRQLTYTTLADACKTVQNGAAFVATNEDVKFPSEQYFLPGNGSLARLVQGVTGVAPTYIGKPSPVMLELIAETFGYDKSDMVMIGDNYDTDILSGIRFGIDTIHVNTGVTSTEAAYAKEQPPTMLVENMMVYAELEKE